jgi:hypothetical protein
VTPDERTLRAHLEQARFQTGEEAGRWRLLGLTWPHATFAISAAPRSESPTEFNLRLDVSGYPHSAPTGSLWDTEGDCSLEPARRPKGDRAAHVFRTDGWAGGATAMYAPWDRIALGSHPNWAQKHPHERWTPTRDITFVLSNLHNLLSADDYLGT